MEIRAIHVNWTKPFFAKNGSGEYYIDGFEVLTTILSALMWRKLNGSIKLYTDTIGYAFYKSLTLLDLWDDGIDTQILESIPSSIDPKIYWAAAKIFAIRNEKAPLVMMDTDLMVWKSLGELESCHLAAFHREPLQTDCYISYNDLKKRIGYYPDSDWDWSVEPCNTALTYFNHWDFKDYYTQSAIDFMIDNNEQPEDFVSQMVFAEQRIFSMCAEKLGIKIHTFLDSVYNGENMDFTHIWGAKDLARTNADFNAQLCDSLINAIIREHPSYKIPEEVFDYIQR